MRVQTAGAVRTHHLDSHAAAGLLFLRFEDNAHAPRGAENPQDPVAA